MNRGRVKFGRNEPLRAFPGGDEVKSGAIGGSLQNQKAVIWPAPSRHAVIMKALVSIWEISDNDQKSQY